MAAAFELWPFLLAPVTTDADNASNDDDVEEVAAAVDVPLLPPTAPALFNAVALAFAFELAVLADVEAVFAAPAPSVAIAFGSWLLLGSPTGSFDFRNYTQHIYN